MRKVLKITILIGFSLLVACGQQGALYYPEDSASGDASAPAQALQETQTQDPENE